MGENQYLTSTTLRLLTFPLFLNKHNLFSFSKELSHIICIDQVLRNGKITYLNLCPDLLNVSATFYHLSCIVEKKYKVVVKSLF